MSRWIAFRLNDFNRFFIDQAFGDQMADIFHSPFLTPLVGGLESQVCELDSDVKILP